MVNPSPLLPARRVKSHMKDVAAHAGVALSSVSRVLNNHPDVSDHMRKRVLAAVAELGYEPDLLASSLRRGSTHTVGFLVTDIANPLFADIAKGAERHLQQAGYSLVLMNSEGDPLRDERGVRLLAQRRVDGLILSVSDETSGELGRTLRALETPVVFLDREMDAVAGAGAVLSDHAFGMQQAAEHLLALGHRRIALLVGPLCIRPDRERLRGFRAAHRRRRLAVVKDLVFVGPALSAQFGEETVERFLTFAPDEQPTAVIAGGNLVLVGVLRALQRHKVRVGRDVSLVSCDDVPLADLYNPPITVVVRDTVEMGAAAARLILDRLSEGGTEPEKVVLPTRLLVRGSTAPAPDASSRPTSGA